MYSKSSADRTAGTVLLIGFLLLLTPLGGIVGGFWPGILFVLGASSLAKGMQEGLPWYNVTGGLWLIGLGLVFLWGFSIPLLLILVGATMLFGYSFRAGRFGAKIKRDEFFDEKPKYDKHDEFV
ncbi:MAG: hypothetical protein ABI700_21100 [Chloroflexota bacterium]